MGVKSSLASLWYVDDEATFMLMTQFYQHLNKTSIKAEALRRSQIALLREQSLTLDLDALLAQLQQPEAFTLDHLQEIANRNFSRPYYWAGFPLVDNPW